MNKICTSIEQSKKLIELGIDVKTADMCYLDGCDEDCQVKDGTLDDEDVYAWSLAALLDTLPNEILTDDRFECHYQIDIRKYDGGDNTTLYQIAYGNNRGSSGSWHDMINTGEKESLIDACYEMILKLHELEML